MTFTLRRQLFAAFALVLALGAAAAFAPSPAWRLVVLGVMTLAGLALAWGLGRSIARRLADTGRAIDAIARGDFGHSLPLRGDDEIAAVQTALVHLQVRLAAQALRRRRRAEGVAGWDGRERRGPNRAKNVLRLRFGDTPVAPPAVPPAARAGSSDSDWQPF